MERVTLIEFDSMEKATATHESAEYQEARRALDGGVTRDIALYRHCSRHFARFEVRSASSEGVEGIF